MKQLTKREIVSTSFPYIPGRWNSAFGYKHTNKDKNEMCIYCKNEHTDTVQDDAYLAQFKFLYGDKKFKVMHCHCCEAIFSFALP